VAGNNKTYLGLQVKCQILTKFVASGQIFMDVPYIKFRGNPSSGTRADTCGQTDGHNEGATGAFCEYVNASKEAAHGM
jgi:hypothetical protein